MSQKQKGFSLLYIVIVLAIFVTGGILFLNIGTFIHSDKVKNQKPEIYNHETKTDENKYGGQVNPYLGTSCQSNPKVEFTHDFTEVDKIKSVEPTIITPGNSRHRAWLNISSGKVAIYAPVDSELVNGVYKNARGALDYDLHF